MSDIKDLSKNLPKNKGGRPRGVITGSRRELFLRCEEMEVDVFGGILALCKSEEIDIRLTALGMAAKHLYPTLKAVEVSGEIDTSGEEKQKQIDHLKTLLAQGSLNIEPKTD